MKRRDFIKLGLIAASAISMSYAARSEDAELIVGSNVGSPPFAFKDGDGYSGFDIEVWAEVAKGLNRKWRVQPMQFGALIPALPTRNIDAIVSQLFIKPERQKVIDFSDPYYQRGWLPSQASAIRRSRCLTISPAKRLEPKPERSPSTSSGSTSRVRASNRCRPSTTHCSHSLLVAAQFKRSIMLADVGHIFVVDDDPTLRQMVIRYL